MHYERLLLLVCVAALSWGTTVAALASLPAYALLRRISATWAPRSCARLLFALRLVPFALGLTAAVGFGLAFIRHEPRQTTEQPGMVLMAAAVWTTALAVFAAWRVSGSAWQTFRRHRLVARIGRPLHLPGFPLPAWRIDTPFPVAAISGVLRPWLIVSDRVLEECTEDELASVLRHERAHARRRDNLVRAFLLALPDAVGLWKGGDRIARQWHQAVEEAADDEAVAANPEARLALASALVRVSRMATDPPPDWMPALALFDGGSLEHRVRRLLDGPGRVVRTPTARAQRMHLIVGRLWTAVLCALVVSGAAWTASGPRPLYALMEWAVRNLP
jgi:Zn-dependent protease with chaperone function